MIFNSFYFGRFGGLERTDLWHFLLWEGLGGFLLVVVLKELIFDTFYFGKVWWSWKNWFLMFSTSEGCCGLERTDFWHFLLWEGMVVLKELIFNVFYFRRVLWSWKNWFLTLSIFEKVWWSWKNWFLLCVWSWKNWFLTLSTLGRYGGLERTDF